MTDGSYEIRSEDPDTLKAELLEKLRVFNEGVAGPYKIQPLSLSIRTDKGSLIGGLSGLFYWNLLHVDLLWVDSQHRRSRYGTALLVHAEQMARKRKCEVIFLDTYSFQAPDFYRRHGYESFGKLE